MESDYWQVEPSLAVDFYEAVKNSAAELKNRYSNSLVKIECEKLISDNHFYPYHVNALKVSVDEINEKGAILLDETYLMNGGFIFENKHTLINQLLDKLQAALENSVSVQDEKIIIDQLKPYYEMKLFSSILESKRIPLTYCQDFIIAAGEGNLDKVKEFLKGFDPVNQYVIKPTDIINSDQLDINAQNQDGQTALMLASANGHIDIVGELLEHCASPRIKNLLDPKKKMAMEYAIEKSHFRVFDLLMKYF